MPPPDRKANPTGQMLLDRPFDLVPVDDIVTLLKTRVRGVSGGHSFRSQRSTAIFTKWRVVAEAPSRCPTTAALRFPD